MKPIDIINETQYVGENKMITSDCFAITFKRVTVSNPVSVNGYPLGDGESLQFEQTENHLDRTQYNVVFGTGGTGNELYVFRTLPLRQYFKD
jgi:hypothetical protein